MLYLNCVRIGTHGIRRCPPCDFRGPEEPVYKDTTAGLCAVCGLLELAEGVPECERKLYRNAALRILKATEDRHCDWSETEDSIVQYGTRHFLRLFQL